MKNTKRLSLIFDEALREAAREVAKEMGYQSIYKNDAITYAKPGNVFSKIISFTGLATFHDYSLEGSDSGLTSLNKAGKVWMVD